jgi:Ca2+-binding EF-hand superfamily protein
MRKTVLAVLGFAALTGAAGLALAQDSASGQRGLFQADANNDGVLTRQEFDAGRDGHFTRLDANSDGQLSREEMRAMRGDRHHRGGRRGMHGLRGADANNDGAITRDEFLARPLQHFDRLDANNDGVISAAERPQRPERQAQGGERRARADRPNPDANGDGQFSRAEFAAMGARLFERLDANSDGQVTRAEAEAARPHRRGRE